MNSILRAAFFLMFFFSVTVAADALAQGSPTWNAVLQAANKEGRVSVYTSTPPAVIQRITSDFEKAYPGIKMEFNRASSGPAIARIAQERQSNADGADVFISTEIKWFIDRVAEKSLIRLAGPSLNGWPSAYLFDGYYVVASLEPLGIAYNTTLVKTPPKGYPDLLRPEYIGKVATSTPIGVSIIGWYDWLEKTQGSDFLVRMAAQKPRMYAGSVTPAQAVASGEVLATFFVNASSVQQLAEQGAPIRFIVPNPARGISFGVAALGWARRPNAAQVATDYLMSRRGQQVWNGTGETASPLKGIQGSLDAGTMSAYDPLEYTPEVVKTAIEKWNRIFNTK